MRELDDITEAIIDAAIQIHRDLGPGLLESVYEAVLAQALEKRGFMWSDKLRFASSTTGLCSKKASVPPSAPPRLRVNQSAPNRFPEG
jgi:hypothetical protein